MPPHGGLPWLTLARHDPRCHPEVRHTRPAGVTPPRCERDVITYHLHFGQWARGIVTEAGWAQGPGPVWQAMGVATGPANDGKPAWAGPRGRLQNVGTRRRCRLRVRRSPSATAPDGHGYRRTAPG